MKNTIIVDLIKGFISGNPKRLYIAQRVLIVICIIGFICQILASNHIWAPPEWLLTTIFSKDSIIAQLSTAFGIQFAKKDINEGK